MFWWCNSLRWGERPFWWWDMPIWIAIVIDDHTSLNIIHDEDVILNQPGLIGMTFRFLNTTQVNPQKCGTGTNKVRENAGLDAYVFSAMVNMSMAKIKQRGSSISPLKNIREPHRQLGNAYRIPRVPISLKSSTGEVETKPVVFGR